MIEKNNFTVVSICCITYNHELYIHQCLEGFMMQKTNFTFEVLIHDDASEDGTANIIREYEAKYPDIIKPIYQTENQYSKGASISATYQFPRAKGKYIAMCEGDDYWTDSYKLQKQVDFLEANPDFNICVHQTDLLENGLIKKHDWRFDKNRTIFTVKDYIYSLFFHTSSAVFRKFEFPSFLNNPNILQGDIALFLSVILDKKVYFITQTMSVYRIHEQGITKSPRHKSRLNAYTSLLLIINEFNEYSKHKFDTYIWIKKQMLLPTIFICRNDKKDIRKIIAKGYYYIAKIFFILVLKLLK
jgi:glycosyltransferase involved in cell wall biosynthesis